MPTKELSPSRLRARGTLASAHAKLKSRPDDPDAQRAVEVASRNYRATALEDAIRRTVEAAPPLTDAQRIRLAALLVTPSGGAIA